MIRYRISMLATLFVLLIVEPVSGADTGSSLEPHVHGIANLLVVFEGTQLDIELRSPAMNLLGFEHSARTSEQQAAVKNTKETLANANSLFNFGPAQCQLTGLDVDMSDMLDKGFHQGKEHHNAEHDANHRDGQEAHDHPNIRARYHYHCARHDQLSSLRTSIPVEFPGIESLQVQWIINGRQGAATLDNSRRHLNFEQ
jgi:hypothetical protein